MVNERNTEPTGTGRGSVSSASTDVASVGKSAASAGSQVKEAATSLAAEAGEKAKGFLNQQVATGADFLSHIGRSASAAADSLNSDAPQLAGWVRSVASGVTDLSTTVRGQSPEALLETASGYVRENPVLVLGAAAACGFALVRLLQGGTWNGSRSGTKPGGSYGSGAEGRPHAI